MSALPGTSRQPALQGVRVLDQSRVLAGPWATMVLADLGADVIKIENPDGGDDTRSWGPAFAAGESAYYLCANRNKRSVAVDLAATEGQRLVRELAAQCDVVVENFRAGALLRYGLDYDALRAVRPDVIYCSISGYGRSSPLADRAGYDYVVQAESGLMAVTGEANGAPMKVGVAVADLFTGMTAVQAILAAVIARRNDGQGQFIDLALYDCQLAMLANVASACLVSGTEPERQGNAHSSVVPYQLMPTQDAAIVLAVGNDSQFRALCERVLKQPGLAQDPRFANNVARLENRTLLVSVLEDRFRIRPAGEWLQHLTAAGIPCGRVRSVSAALAAPETAAREMVATVPHPKAGALRMVASPIRMSGTPVREPTAPPLLGQHTDEVLRELLDTEFPERPPIRAGCSAR